MANIINIDEITVVKNITDELYIENIREIESVVNNLVHEILNKKAFVDIDDRTLIRVKRNDNDLTVSIDDMCYSDYFKEQTFDDWF